MTVSKWKFWMIIISPILSFTACQAQIKNAKTENVKIFGNCSMCETTIEKAGNLKKVANVDWNKDNQMATITYDTTKTNQDEILKRIALSGYDSEKFLAPNDVYANLPGCCQYERATPILEKMAENNEDTTKAQMTMNQMDHKQDETKKPTQKVSPLTDVFDNYFAVKDALVKTDENVASDKAQKLLLHLNAIKVEQLSTNEKAVWTNVEKGLKDDVQKIADTKDISLQRAHFITLSKNIFELAKVSKHNTPTYLQHCPMANDGKGADWLSKENVIKNPYYGAQMLSCGKIVQTIK
jgi:copper chaperone CopZ